MKEIDGVRYQRDTCRVRCRELERENARLTLMLKYANEAIQAEFQLRAGRATEVLT